MSHRTQLSDARLEIAIHILDETKNHKLRNQLIRGICQADPWVKRALKLYGFDFNTTED